MAAVHPFKHRVSDLLALAGVRLDGDRDWDLRVHDERLYARLLADGSLGLGEGYMDGWWGTRSLDGLLTRLLQAELDQRVHGWHWLLDGVRARLTNLQTRWRSRAVGERHYDLGNDLYRAMLGSRLVYSCGYWAQAEDLDAAQEA